MATHDRFVQDDAQVLSQEVLFSAFGKILRLTLRHRLFAGGWGESIVRETLRTSTAVGVLLIDRMRQEVVMLKQFRPAVALSEETPWLWRLLRE